MKLTKRLIISLSAFSMTVGALSAQTNIIGDLAGTTYQPDVVGSDSNLGNGDFETNTGTAISAISNWHNAAGNETFNHGQTNGLGGSPQAGITDNDGMYWFNNREMVNDTGYTITATGEVFSFETFLYQHGGFAGYSGDESFEIELFTTTETVDGTFVSADKTESLGATSITPGWGNPTRFEGIIGAADFYTTIADDIGKTVYFSMTFNEGVDDTNNAFPRVDTLALQVVVPEPSAYALLSGALALGLVMVRRRRA
ncbi:MAG: PEP-CTERM sorting domain-containing protein [Opitutaceae bacterium]